MKRIISLLITVSFIYIESFAQDNPYKYFKLEQGSIKFEAIYMQAAKSVDSIADALMRFIPTVRGVKNVHQNATGITADIDGYEFDYKSFGLSQMGNTPVQLIHPLMAALSIDVKEGKYRVTISNVLLCTEDYMKGNIFYKMPLTVAMTNFSGKELASAKGKIKTWRYLEDDFYNAFILTESKSNW